MQEVANRVSKILVCCNRKGRTGLLAQTAARNVDHGQSEVALEREPDGQDQD